MDQAATRSLSNVVNNSGIVKQSRRFIDFLSGHEITRILHSLAGSQTTSYLVFGSQSVKKHFIISMLSLYRSLQVENV